MPVLRDSILETIGDTPVVALQRMAPDGATLYAKLEAFNPAGSVKDRMALAVIEDAERRGQLRPGDTVVEASSGNTGIGLAMVCARKGHRLVVVMPENCSLERRKLMRFFGADVVLTPAVEKGSGMFAKAVELADAHGWFLPRQFENRVNAEVHERTTAREILSAFAGRDLDCFVTGTGTGGTLCGVARVLKRERPGIRIVVCEPDNSAMVASGIASDFHANGLPVRSHTRFRPHIVQGWSPDFVPRLVADALAEGLVDEVLPVSGDAALEAARDLARLEGILAGISAGATVAGALSVCAHSARGASVLCMLPDTGERYLSTVLFDHIAEDMNARELEIARSTPGYRFDRLPSFAMPATPESEIRIAPSAELFVEEAVTDPANPVVVFTLAWCEFCWSVRKLFEQAAIPYRAIEIDTPERQVHGFDGEIRKALRKRIGSPTIPQVFIAGRHVGGCTETLDAWKDGSLKDLLADAEVPCRPQACPNPRDLMPAWLHVR